MSAVNLAAVQNGGHARAARRCRPAASEQRRLSSRSGGSEPRSCGPAGESARPSRCGGTEGLDHSRDPGRGRAVCEGVDHVTADQGIGIPGQLEQSHPHPVVVGPDVAGAQVLARELASPAFLAAGTAPGVRREHPRLCACRRPAGRPLPSRRSSHRPTVQTIASAVYPDHGLSRRLAQPWDPQLHWVTRSG